MHDDAAFSTAPLTVEQRNWLWVNAILPTAFAVPLIAGMGGVLLFLRWRFGNAPFMTIFVALGALLLVAITAAVVLHVANNARDVRAGVALVGVGRLVARRDTGRSPRTHYATFDVIGEVIVPYEIYVRLESGHRYRVVFSRHTRRCWSAEAIMV